MIVTRPAAAVKPARPPGEPLVLSGKFSVGLPRLSTKRTAPCDFDGLHACGKLTRPSPCATATGMREPAMPWKKMLGESSTSSVATRDSYCSDALRRNFGQRSEERRVGTSVSVRVDHGCRRIIKKKKQHRLRVRIR